MSNYQEWIILKLLYTDFYYITYNYFSCSFSFSFYMKNSRSVNYNSLLNLSQYLKR